VFDETKAIQGAIGQYATIARKAGQQWFVGSINAGERRTLKIPLGFLDPSRLYDAHIYADGAPDGTNRTAVSCESRQVKATDVIIADLAAHGGHAMRLTPCK
jgi:alpha-glucosidase